MAESMLLHPFIADVTARIIDRSRESRRNYLEMVDRYALKGPARESLSAGNQAHAYAGCALNDKEALIGANWPNVGIVTAYNDMLSAHAPYEAYPEQIRMAAREVGATAQVAGGVPAMCDGVTQGQEGMELSLFSRDVIAMSTAIALSHASFDAGLFLGICDKIVPGLLIGALQFGHLPALFIPAGPMPSGLPNKEKARIRQLYAEGKIGREKLLEAEMQSYHSPGTCTFYGTANSNQMLMEIAGLHLPGAAFEPPGTELRKALTRAATQKAVKNTALAGGYQPVGNMLDARSFVNMIVGLMATGGSTNHCLHIPAIAAAAGYVINWQDLDEISSVTPLLTRIYPNGEADVNHFHAAGGMGFVIRELLGAGLLHADVSTVLGKGLAPHCQEPYLRDGQLQWRDPPAQSAETSILRPASDPFDEQGGLRLLQGPLGRSVIKVSAVEPQHRKVTAPARIFENQDAVKAAFEAGELNRDVVVVVRFQGPQANGMPELHKLTPALSVLQNRGHKVALVTDGRMSGASGKVPAAIHICPEAQTGGAIASLRDGDVITLDAQAGRLDVAVSSSEFAQREPVQPPRHNHPLGLGRHLFSGFRRDARDAEYGGGLLLTGQQ